MIGAAIVLALAAAAADLDADAQERALRLQKELRCVVCQNESINDSSAPLAADMRALLRERIAAGDSDEEILRLFSSRYGDFVRMTPRFSAKTAALWAGPALFVALGGLAFAGYLRRRPAEPPAPLGEDELAALAALEEREQ